MTENEITEIKIGCAVRQDVKQDCLSNCKRAEINGWLKTGANNY